MKVTYNLEINSKANRNGLHLLFIRLRYKGKLKRISTHQYIPKAVFEDGKIKKSYPNHNEIQLLITNKILEYQKLFINKPIDKEDEVFNSVNITVKYEVDDLIEYYVKLLDKLKLNKYSNWNKYNNSYKKLIKFKPKLKFVDFTYNFIISYEQYLISKGNALSTIRQNMRELRFIYNSAVRDFELSIKDPFINYTYPKATFKPVALNEQEIIKLENVKLNRFKDLVRDAFLFSYYCQGMRFSDVIFCKKSYIVNNTIQYQMLKTNNKVDVPLNKKSLQLINKYNTEHIIPIVKYKSYTDVEKYEEIWRKSTNINSHLKDIAKLAGIKPFTFHSARHSFANLAINKGIDIYTISKMLGHTSVSTTERYLKNFNQNMIEKAMNILFD